MLRIVKSFSNSIKKILLDHPSNYMHIYTAAQVKNLKKITCKIVINNTNTSLISIFHDLTYTTIDVVFYYFIQQRCNIQHVKKEAVTHLYMSFSGEKKTRPNTTYDRITK